MDISSLIVFLRLTALQKFEVRKHIVSRVQPRETVVSVARGVPFTARTNYRWVARFALGRFKYLHDRKRTGRRRKWTPEHAEWIYKVVVNKTSQQCQFEFALWTTNRVRIAFSQ